MSIGGRGGGVIGGAGEGVFSTQGRGGAIGGSSRQFVRPPSFHRPGHPRHLPFAHMPFFGHHHRHFNKSFVFLGFGASAFYPAWWWYDPYYSYWAPPAAYYSGYYGYPYYDYYGDPYWSDPCMSSDPAYAAYCLESSDPSQGEYGAPPVGYPEPEAPVQPESESGPPPPAELPTSSGY